MIKIIKLGAIGVLAFASAGTASAYSLSPKNASFTGTGTTTLTKGSLTVPCTAKFKGETDAKGIGHITSATFSGNILCGGVKATGLPWLGKASSATGGTITDVSVTASVFGACGPTTIPLTLSKTGVLAFNNVTLKPDCAIKGSIATKPMLTIVKP
jgi:hypothetical protein